MLLFGPGAACVGFNSVDKIYRSSEWFEALVDLYTGSTHTSAGHQPKEEPLTGPSDYNELNIANYL